MARLLLILALIIPGSLAAESVTVEGVRTSAGGDKTRVVFDLTGPVEHRIFSLDDPHRVVIDLSGARFDSRPGRVDAGVIRRLRSAPRGEGDLRVVLDISGPVQTQSFRVEPNAEYGHRLVVDLDAGAGDSRPVRTADAAQREFTVAIDAGHGGRDPGAIGPTGLLEKDVVLSVSRKLHYILEQTPGIRPLLTREDDRFVPLAERREQARSNRADVFVSIHADAVESGGPRGSSVYTLSRNGASSQAARLLAQRENSADLLGDVSLADKDDLTRQVLVDLSRGATLEASVDLASGVLEELAGIGPVHRPNVERARFVVLKSLDMPSVLVELAFISNAREEQRLRRTEAQWELARAVARGVQRYAERHRPAGMQMASSREYRVQRGDTLSAIARDHQVSLSALRSANDLDGDRIVVGSTLRIPR